MPEQPHDPGLQTPHGPAAALEHPRRFTKRSVALQLIGVAISLALFGWAISLALEEKNRASLQALGDAPAGMILLLLGLTTASHISNGGVFWLVMLPAKRLPVWDMFLVNNVSTLLTLFPFKLSVLVRGLIHHRRHEVPFKDLVAWFAAVGALGFAVLAPLGAAMLWRREVDAWFLIAGLGGAAAASLGGWWLCTLTPNSKLLRRLALGGDRFIRPPIVPIGHYLLRLVDVGILAARIAVAAEIVAVAIDAESAALLACGYFLATVLAFAGTLGFAEMGTAGVAELIGADGESFALVALLVTATQTAVALVFSAIAIPALRLDRMLLPKRRRKAPAAGAGGVSPGG